MRKRNHNRDETGAAAVELALVLPLLLLVLVGIVEFGRGYHAKVTLTHAAREGARALAVGTDPADVVDLIEANVDGLDASAVSITGNSECDPGEIVTIELHYDLDFAVPFWSDGTWDVDSSGSMRCGG